MMQLQDLHYEIAGQRLLSGLNLSISGGPVALLGPNGAGKSTLLGLLADGGRFGRGRLHGRLTLDGAPLAEQDLGVLARRRAFLPQHHSAGLNLPVSEILALSTWPHGGGKLAASLHDEALVTWQLAPLYQRHYNSLSGGERQRVQLARTWLQMRQQAVAEKRIWLLDEPQSALDLPHQQRLHSVLKAEARVGALIVFSTHDLNFALHSAERLLLLKSGRIEADGPPDLMADSDAPDRVFAVDFLRLHRHGDARPWLVPTPPETPT